MSIRSIRKLLAVAWDTTADICTIQNSTSGSIPAGTVAAYGEPVLSNRPSQKVVLVTPDGATATGQCTLSRSGLGTCMFSNGTGWLAGFHAMLKVSTSPDGGVNWVGTYYFSPAT